MGYVVARCDSGERLRALDGLVERVVVVERPRCPRCVAVDACGRGGRRGNLTRVWGVGSGFGKWMQTSYSDAFTSAVKGKKGFTFATYDHVYIDVNNVLHVAAHHTKNEDAFFKKLFALLDLTMRRTRPQYTVTLALDGPAPIAKTITQRRRRIRLSSGEKVPLSEDPRAC